MSDTVHPTYVALLRFLSAANLLHNFQEAGDRVREYEDAFVAACTAVRDHPMSKLNLHSLQSRMFQIAVMMTPATLNKKEKTLSFNLKGELYYSLNVGSTTEDKSVFSASDQKTLETYLKEQGVWELV